MTRFDHRGVSIPITLADPARFTILYLPDDTAATDSHPGWLAGVGLNVIAPPRPASRWLPRVDPHRDPDGTAEQFLLEFIADPSLPCPRPRAIFGGEAALRIGFRHPATFPVVACWDGDLDFHDAYGRGTVLDRCFTSREQARQQTAILQVRPGECPDAIGFGCPVDSIRARGHDRLHEKLNAVGVLHDYWTGDDCPIDSILDFLVRGLEKRSRKLL